MFYSLECHSFMVFLDSRAPINFSINMNQALNFPWIKVIFI